METRAELIFKWSVYSALSLLILLLQGFLPELRLSGAALFLPPVLVAIVSSLEPGQQGVIFAGCFGLVCDLALLGPIPCFYLMSFLLIGLLSLLISRRIVNTRLILSLAVSATALVVDALLRLLILLCRGGGDLGAAALLLGAELLLTLPVAVPLHFLFAVFHRRFHFYH